MEILLTLGTAFSSLITPTAVGAGLSAPALPAAAAASTGLFGTGITAGQALGAGLAAGGTLYTGVRANQASKFEADQLKKKGDDEFAIGQRGAAAKRREKQLALSRVAAVSAASGAGTSDPGVTELMADIENQGEYNALTEMYKGRLEQVGLRGQGQAVRAQGKGDLISSIIGAGSNLYSGLRKKRDDYGYGYG